jgi:hypothetical protein
VIDIHRVKRRAEWEELQKLDRLQRSIRVVRARLGMVARDGLV